MQINMDKGKNATVFMKSSNNKIYMELKDIIREHALQFLPAKSLLRCRGVCRDWKYLIATPFFVHNQSYSFRNLSGFFSQSSTSEPSFISLNPIAYGVPDPSLSFLPEPVDVRSSSNGLLCCQGHSGYNPYYICNPATKHWHKLPKPNNDHGSDPAVVLIFEPSILNFAAEYKLVCAFPSELDGYEFEIYSSCDKSWKTSGEIFLGNLKILPRSGVYTNGIVYWAGRNNRILAFDLSAERSQIHNGHGTLGVMDGKFCTASILRQNLSVQLLSNAYANTMQMYSNIKAWESHLFTLDRSVFAEGYPEEVTLLVNDTVILRKGKALYSYNLKTKETKHLGNESDDGKRRVVPYVNSLVDI